MTVPNDVRVNDFLGDNITLEYALTYKLFDATDCEVWTLVTGTDPDGAVQLVLGSDYLVGNLGEEYASITLSSAVPVGTTLSVQRWVPYTQETNIRNQSGFYPKVLENRYDRNVMMIQQLEDRIDEHYAEGNKHFQSAFGNEVAPPWNIGADKTDRINKVLGFNAAGDPVMLDAQSSDAIGLTVESYTATAGQTTFPLQAEFSGFTFFQVFVGGVHQVDGWALNGNSLVFDEALEEGTKVTIYGSPEADAGSARTFKDVAAVLADTTLSYTDGTPVVEGDIITTRFEHSSFSVAAESAIDNHAITAGGVKLYEAGTTYSTLERFTSAVTRGGLGVGEHVETLGYSAAGDGGAARYRIAASTSEAASFYVTLSTGDVAILVDNQVHPLQVGYDINAANMTTTDAVDANWAIMKSLIADVKASGLRQLPKFDQIWTPGAIFAEWLAGRSVPVGFYSDSTTDGATTTDHVSSTGSTSPFGVTVNESPNAYPKIMENFAGKVTNLTTSIRCYNGGFDSQSFKNGFGLQQWYNTWFRGLSGSNVNWSDVGMIVIGFGTTDSIPPSPGDTAGIIDAYEPDLEAVMIDCFLRGVQPVLQGPVMTFHTGGTTIAYRDAAKSVTIIEAVQKRLAAKYGVPFWSMADPVQPAIDNWEGFNWRDFTSTDGVHPNDMGHRLHAGYLLTLFNDNIPKLTADKWSVDIPPGHPGFVLGDHTDIIFPSSVGGLVLKQRQQAWATNNAYTYEWLDADGNGKTAGEELVRMPIWVDKPSVLVQTTVENNRVTKPITLESMTLLDTSITAGNVFEAMEQPETEYYSQKQMLTFLYHGMNIVYVYASDDGPDQKLGGFAVYDLEAFDDWTVSRGTGGGSYFTKTKSFAPSYEPYIWKTGNRHKRRPSNYYNGGDNIFTYITFDLAGDLAAGTTYSFYTHINDVDSFQDCYNILEILGDDVTTKTVTTTGTTVVNTQTISGLNAKLVLGAQVTLRFKPRYVSSLGMQCTVLVNGATEYNHTSVIGDQWTDGYGFQAPDVFFRHAEISTRTSIRGLIDLDRIF